MLSILSITFPVFAIIGAGYGFTRYGLFTSRDIAVLGRFVMLIALPALLFHATATRSFGELVEPGFFIIMILAGLSTQALMWLSMRMIHSGPRRRAVGIMGAATPNSAFLAFPINQMLFPEYAASILAMCLLVENFILNPISLTIMDAACQDGPENRLRSVSSSLISVIKRPMIAALIVGALVSVIGIPLPKAIDRPLELLSFAASPIALFNIGGALVGLPMQGNLRLAGGISFFKLIVHPLVTTTLLLLFTALALPHPDGAMAAALILSTAMPVFGIFPLLSLESGQSGAASLTVLISTVAAFFTLTVFMAILL